MEALTFDQISDYCSNAESLPQLPQAPLQLTEMIDRGQTEGAELERVVLSSPALTAGVLRAANSAFYAAGARHASTVKGAIQLLGLRALRANCVGMWIDALMNQETFSAYFDPERFAYHGSFVGFLSRYLFSCRQKSSPIQTDWTAEELFAAGVMHDLGLGLMAHVAPGEFDFIYMRAQAQLGSLESAFEDVYGHRAGELAIIASEAWNLPDIFVQALRAAEDSAEQDSRFVSVCLQASNEIANVQGHGIQTWTYGEIDPQFLKSEFGLEEDSMAEVFELVATHSQQFFRAA